MDQRQDRNFWLAVGKDVQTQSAPYICGRAARLPHTCPHCHYSNRRAARCALWMSVCCTHVLEHGSGRNLAINVEVRATIYNHSNAAQTECYCCLLPATQAPVPLML